MSLRKFSIKELFILAGVDEAKLNKVPSFVKIDQLIESSKAAKLLKAFRNEGLGEELVDAIIALDENGAPSVSSAFFLAGIVDAPIKLTKEGIDNFFYQEVSLKQGLQESILSILTQAGASEKVAGDILTQIIERGVTLNAVLEVLPAVLRTSEVTGLSAKQTEDGRANAAVEQVFNLQGERIA